MFSHSAAVITFPVCLTIPPCLPPPVSPAFSTFFPSPVLCLHLTQTNQCIRPLHVTLVFSFHFFPSSTSTALSSCLSHVSYFQRQIVVTGMLNRTRDNCVSALTGYYFKIKKEDIDDADWDADEIERENTNRISNWSLSSCIWLLVFSAVGDQVLEQDGTLIVWWGGMIREYKLGGWVCVFECLCICEMQYQKIIGMAHLDTGHLSTSPLYPSNQHYSLSVHTVCICVPETS